MKLDKKKRLAAAVLQCSEKRVVFNTERLSEIKEAITKYDIKKHDGIWQRRMFI